MKIEDHDFSDGNIYASEDFTNMNGLNGPFIALDVRSDRVHINRADAIAIAKSLKLKDWELNT